MYLLWICVGHIFAFFSEGVWLWPCENQMAGQNWQSLSIDFFHFVWAQGNSTRLPVFRLLTPRGRKWLELQEIWSIPRNCSLIFTVWKVSILPRLIWQLEGTCHWMAPEVFVSDTYDEKAGHFSTRSLTEISVLMFTIQQEKNVKRKRFLKRSKFLQICSKNSLDAPLARWTYTLMPWSFLSRASEFEFRSEAPPAASRQRAIWCYLCLFALVEDLCIFDCSLSILSSYLQHICMDCMLPWRQGALPRDPLWGDNLGCCFFTSSWLAAFRAGWLVSSCFFKNTATVAVFSTRTKILQTLVTSVWRAVVGRLGRAAVCEVQLNLAELLRFLRFALVLLVLFVLLVFDCFARGPDLASVLNLKPERSKAKIQSLSHVIPFNVFGSPVLSAQGAGWMSWNPGEANADLLGGFPQGPGVFLDMKFMTFPLLLGSVKFCEQTLPWTSDSNVKKAALISAF